MRQAIVRRSLVRLSSALSALVLVAWLGAGSALADSPHFNSSSVSGVNSSGNLVVSFKESGLGNNALITYVASADGVATYACINGGGNHPSASNKETVSGPVTASGTFSSGKNGTISQSLTLSPPSAGSFSCPNGQKLVLAFVSYSNVALADTTNHVTVTFTGTFSACLFPNVGIC